jgi:ATP phosphoribosyltransferase regulatory subunit
MGQLYGDKGVEAIAAAIREQFARLGAVEARTSVVQSQADYVEFLGEPYRDKLVEYDAGSGAELCLRPDLTLAVALDVAARRLSPGTYFYDDIVFRGARKHTRIGRPPEPVQRQVGVEVFGSTDRGRDDLNLLVNVCTALETVGVDDFTITFSNVGLIFALIDTFDCHENWKIQLKRSFSGFIGIHDVLDASNERAQAPSSLSLALANLPREQARKAVAEIFTMTDLVEIGSRSVDEIADRLVEKAHEAQQPLSAESAEILLASRQVDDTYHAALETLDGLLAGSGDRVTGFVAELRALGEGLIGHGIDAGRLRIDTDLPRSLSYYDGFIFEVHSADGQRFLGGGGRYDRLVRSLSRGEMDTTALGAMLRPDRISQAL